MNSSFTTLSIGCNLVFDVRFHLNQKNRPIVILSSGYAPGSFDDPLPVALINLFESSNLSWAQYIYPERDERNGVKDLLISSGLSALKAVCEWAKRNGFKEIAFYGVSFGANITLEIALLEPATFVILVNPVFNYYDYRCKQLGEKMMNDWQENGVIDIHYKESTVKTYYRFIEEAINQDLFNRAVSIETKVLAMQGAKDERLSVNDINVLGRKAKSWYPVILPQGEHSIRDLETIKLITHEISLFIDKA